MIFNTHYQYIGGGGVPKFEYTGTYEYIDDGGGNWRIKFLTSGVFTPLKDMTIDAFLVGGGAAGKGVTWNAYGGAGGFTTTVKKIALTKNTEYNVVIGAGGSGNGGAGEASSGFTGTAAGANATPGQGGSGGAYMKYSGHVTQNAGSDGANGYEHSPGQGSTTREFGESTGDLYAGGGGAAHLDNPSNIIYAKAGEGGGGGISGLTPLSGTPNTGGGGCGQSTGAGHTNQGDGGSGIVIIRNAR